MLLQSLFCKWFAVGLPYLNVAKSPCLFGQALRIKDVAPLLQEYHRLRPLGLTKATLEQGSLAAGPALWQKFALQAETVGRYNHYRPGDLRVGDVTGLQAEFQQLFVSQ